MSKVLQARTASVKFCKFCSPNFLAATRLTDHVRRDAAPGRRVRGRRPRLDTAASPRDARDARRPLLVAESARNEATREALATELEAALDDADALRDALRRRAPPPRPTADRRSVSAPVEAVASLEADLDALRRDVASLRPRQQAWRPTWLLFAGASLALTAWVLTPPEDPYYAALTS